MRYSLAVVVPPGGERGAAELLARRLGVPCLDAAGPGIDYVLTWQRGRLSLGWNAPRSPAPVSVDFTAGAVAHRWRSAASKDRELGRALGLRRGVRTVLDATAGLGRDAFVLACCGAVVHAVERVPAIAALVEDALDRARRHPATAALLGERLTVEAGDAREVLSRVPAPDAVYLDPMFPARRKSAAVKKEMQLFAELVGDDDDAHELLAAARRVARLRTVVKRPRHAPPLAGRPDAAVHGSRVRWDLYLAPADQG